MLSLQQLYSIYAQYLGGFMQTMDISSANDMISMSGQAFSFVFVSVGAFILMIKTPRVLKNLVA